MTSYACASADASRSIIKLGLGACCVYLVFIQGFLSISFYNRLLHSV